MRCLTRHGGSRVSGFNLPLWRNRRRRNSKLETRKLKLRHTFLTVTAFVVILSTTLAGYSVLSHEQIIDLVWNDQLAPLLRAHYPGLTEEQLREAHAYAYGGAVIQDLGYYPFGSKEFSDLVHYVRSGDFVTALIDESRDMNELAFALGALSHYASDI